MRVWDTVQTVNDHSQMRQALKLCFFRVCAQLLPPLIVAILVNRCNLLQDVVSPRRDGPRGTRCGNGQQRIARLLCRLPMFGLTQSI